MTYDEFVERTQRSIAELLRLTNQYVDVSLSGKEVRFRVEYLPVGVPTGESITLEELIACLWNDEALPYLIFLYVAQETESATIFKAAIGLPKPHAHPDWEERLKTYHQSLVPYYPYMVRLPRVPNGWRRSFQGELVGKRNRVFLGPTSMERSLEINGRYPLPQS